MSHRKHHRHWKKLLLPGENIVYMFGVSRLYIVIFWMVPAMVLFVLMIYLGLFSLILGLLAALAVLSMGIPILYLWYFVHYAVTDQRVMTREGILHKRFVTADLPSVTDITVNEAFFERLLTRTGDIGVNTAGSDNVELHFRHIRRPFIIRRDIYERQNSWRAKDKAGYNNQNSELTIASSLLRKS